MVITVSWPTIAGERRARLTEPFCIGGDASGELQIDEQKVTQAYAAVFLRDGQWWVRDLGCPDGLVLNGARVDSEVLPRRATLGLGSSGLQATLELDEPPLPTRPIPGRLLRSDVAANRTQLHARASVPQPSSGADRLAIVVRVGAESTPREYRDRARIGRDASCGYPRR